jgi:hypothetical protein
MNKSTLKNPKRSQNKFQKLALRMLECTLEIKKKNIWGTWSSHISDDED